MNNLQISEILALADSYENQLSNYHFYNDELFELNKTEKEIKKMIEPFLNNDDLLLEMIKQHWSIIRFVDKDNSFFIKACTINPECGREARDLELLIQLYKINPSITEFAPSYYKKELEEYLKDNYENVSQKSQELIERKTTDLNEPDESHISQMSVYDFLKLRMERRQWYKLAGMITNKQVVFQVARGDLDDHWSMDSKLSQAIFPNRGYNMGNVYTRAIGVFGFGYELSIDIPNEISFQQYEALINIVNQVKQFEVDYDRKIDNFDADSILKEAQTKLSISNTIYENDEVIIGTPHDKKYLKEAEEQTELLANWDDDWDDEELFFESDFHGDESLDDDWIDWDDEVEEDILKDTIEDYEEKKHAYEETSASNELMVQVGSKTKEEIDADLEEFETEERRILNSKHFSEEQKKEMIENLYSKFDKYTEENPELLGRHM